MMNSMKEMREEDMRRAELKEEQHAAAWQAELDNDPAYLEWVENEAMAFNYSHARMPGEY